MRAQRFTSHLVLCLTACAAPVRADVLRLLHTPGHVSPDGFAVAAERLGPDGARAPLVSPVMEADGATVKPVDAPGPLRGFWVTPRAGVRELVLRLKDGTLEASAALPVGPPAGRVELALSPPSPVKNRDESAELRVRVLKLDGSPDLHAAPPVVRANVGTLEPLRAMGGGEYRTRYHLPKTRYPEVAVLVALSAWPHPQAVHGVSGHLRVPLASAVELPGATEANAQVSLQIGKAVFGPVQAGTDGRFRLPIVVPPGVGKGAATAVDRLGNRRGFVLDLMLPPTDPLACIASPVRLPANGVAQARVLCAVSDAGGKPLAGAPIRLVSKRGRLGPGKPLERGMLEWRYTAPRDGDADVLEASWVQRGHRWTERFQLELTPPPAHRVRFEPPEPPVHHGSERALMVEVLDASGRPRAGARVVVQADVGTLTPPPQPAPPRFELRWRGGTPTEAERLRLRARAWGPEGADPARFVVWNEGGQLWGAVTDLGGLPVPAQQFSVDGRQVVSGDDGAAALGPARDGALELRHALWPSLQARYELVDGGRQAFPAFESARGAWNEEAVPLAPAVPVNVRVAVRGRDVRSWVEDPGGALLPNRPLSIVLSRGSVSGQRAENGGTSFRAEVDGPASLSVTDVLTGVTAVVEVGP